MSTEYIVDFCLQEILKKDITPSEKLVLCYLLANENIKCFDSEHARITCHASYAQIISGTLLSSKAVRAAIKKMSEKGIIKCDKTHTPYRFDVSFEKISWHNEKRFNQLTIVELKRSANSDSLGRNILRYYQGKGKKAYFLNNLLLDKMLIASREKYHNSVRFKDYYDVLIINEPSGYVAPETFDVVLDRITNNKTTYFLFRGDGNLFAKEYSRAFPNDLSIIPSIWNRGKHVQEGDVTSLWSKPDSGK